MNNILQHTQLKAESYNQISFTYKENEVEEDNQKLDNFCSTLHTFQTTAIKRNARKAVCKSEVVGRKGSDKHYRCLASIQKKMTCLH